MGKSRREDFDSRIGKTSHADLGNSQASGIWELPDHVLDAVSGANDFSQAAPGGGVNFAQNFSCFAQNIGNFSQGTPPKTPRLIDGGNP
jgi:hypothetical protein